ncbi:uncharacterized protein LACBIDRAFT_302545 [Laccaria bicolor S238N-H82]|uniref:Predicted protein n=1 Tax=Laccaria bicolor (strain S238N-H82 / ATCC MYA-4686) TaxID=486041 RepID=B0DHV2_LACBS|nr:uncharacterized protein LACBIDRAFT_302545 [Laccaria bicolor S238N-H82]EDR05898.1 predicted protein [Laccaria bicolor S238N-H82]|eukprot:XP_001883574.1 predicted protein [Laccaria bicolor S238N-H82]
MYCSGNGGLYCRNVGRQVAAVAHKENANILRGLVENQVFIRISGFVNGAFVTWVPKLYAYHVKILKELLAHDPELFWVFTNSGWAAAMFNIRPKMACFPHRDHRNLLFGWCGITALGDYNPDTGGHIMMWELGLVICFPPSSSINLPSAAVEHSNVPTRPGEHCFSFTQYSAGGLFCWVEHGFQKEEVYFNSLTDKEQDHEVNRMWMLMKESLITSLP